MTNLYFPSVCPARRSECVEQPRGGIAALSQLPIFALADSLLHDGDAKAARVLVDKAVGPHFNAPLARPSEPLAQR